MARRSIIASARPKAASSGWRLPVLVGVMALGLIALGRCSGQTIDLQARKSGAAVTVDATGIESWSQFFACYPLPDAYVKISVMRQYASDGDPGQPPSRVRIPLEADGKAISQAEAGWLSDLRSSSVVCPVAQK
jgi:hypothetical protein